MLKNIILITFLFFFISAFADDLSYRYPPFMEQENLNSTEEKHFIFGGPFFEYYRPSSKQFFFAGIRPLFSTCSSQKLQENQGDLLWPFGGWRHRCFEKNYYFYPWFYRNILDQNKQESRIRWGIFPIFCYGERKNHTRYCILFPIGGTVDDIGGIEHFSCCLWPLWVQTQKGKNISNSFFWPIFSRTKVNNEIVKERIWPLWGYATDINGTKSFILWPFFHLQKGTFNSQSPIKQDGFFIFPLYGKKQITNKQKENKGNATTLLWPFFSWEDAQYQSLTYHKRTYFWPLYSLTTEKNNQAKITKKRFISWPFYGNTILEDHQSYKIENNFILWPLYFQNNTINKQRHYHSKRIGIIYHQVEQIINQKKQTSKQIWPLCQWQTYSENNQHSFSLLSLWPTATIPPAPIARNWMPLWSLYAQYANSTEFHQRLLWGIWERRHTPTFSRYQFWPFFRFDQKREKNQEKITKRLSFIFNIFSFSF